MQQWIIRDSRELMAELRTIFALLVLLVSIKIEEKWRSSAPFVRSSSIRLLQQTEIYEYTV
jgi:hypothetical protein